MQTKLLGRCLLRFTRRARLWLSIGAALALCVSLLLGAERAQARPLSAIVTVTSTANSGAGSLRAALSSANPGDTIQFSLPPDSVIVLTSGQLPVTQTLTIDGSTAVNLAVSGNNASRVFNVSAPLTIISLTIQNGSVTGSGGGISTNSPLTLIGVTIQNNSATTSGGGVDANDTVIMSDTQFLSNTASSNGGGLEVTNAAILTNATFINNTSTNNRGGGAYFFGVTTVTGGLFERNSVPGAGAVLGGGLGASLDLTLSGTVFLSNTTAGDGGGLFTFGPAALTNAVFIGNVALRGGGAYFVGSSTSTGGYFERNTATGFDGGGGLSASDMLSLSGTQFRSNSAAQGGGLRAAGPTTLSDTSFQNNQCTNSGCLSGGWLLPFSVSALTLTNFITTGDNIQNHGLTTQAAGSVILFNGTLSQTIAGVGSTTFNDMWVNNSGLGVWLGQQITVTNRLTLTSDLTTTDAYTLNLTSGATSAGSGDVWGRTRREHAFSTGTTYPFGNPNVSVNFANGTLPTQMTVNLTRTIPADANYSNAVTRYYSITQVGASGFTATLRLHYQDSELNGNSEAGLNLRRAVGINYQKYVPSASNMTENWVESNAVTAFSPWLVAEQGPQAPSAVRLVRVGAASGGFDVSGLALLALAGAGAGLFVAGVMQKRRR